MHFSDQFHKLVYALQLCDIYPFRQQSACLCFVHSLYMQLDRVLMNVTECCAACTQPVLSVQSGILHSRVPQWSFNHGYSQFHCQDIVLEL